MINILPLSIYTILSVMLKFHAIPVSSSFFSVIVVPLIVAGLKNTLVQFVYAAAITPS